ncbi:MAG: YggT family protein [gamma proteobacterium endosymbiont of Trioza apicalis]
MFIFIFLFKIIIDFYIIQLLLRIWMEYLYCDFYHPLSKVVYKITQPFIKLSRYITSIFMLNNIYIGPIILIYILSLIKLILIMHIEIKFVIFKPIYLIIALFIFLKNYGKLLFLILIIRSWFSWSNYTYNNIGILIYTLSDKLLNFIKYISFTLINFDFSIIITMLIIYFFNFICLLFFPGIWYLI